MAWYSDALECIVCNLICSAARIKVNVQLSISSELSALLITFSCCMFSVTLLIAFFTKTNFLNGLAQSCFFSYSPSSAATLVAHVLLRRMCWLRIGWSSCFFRSCDKQNLGDDGVKASCAATPCKKRSCRVGPSHGDCCRSYLIWRVRGRSYA